MVVRVQGQESASFAGFFGGGAYPCDMRIKAKYPACFPFGLNQSPSRVPGGDAFFFFGFSVFPLLPGLVLWSVCVLERKSCFLILYSHTTLLILAPESALYERHTLFLSGMDDRGENQKKRRVVVMVSNGDGEL